MKVVLLSFTKDAERLSASAARSCYSKKSASEILDDLDDENATKAISKITGMGHHSVIEHAAFTFSLEGVSRSLTHQLIRHRIASYCLSGDSVVLTDDKSRAVKRRTIRSIYSKKEQYWRIMKIRSLDYRSGLILDNRMKKVVYSGAQPVFLIRTADGYSIKATQEHRFLTESGFRRLEDLAVGDRIYTNGEPLYRNREWLEAAYNGRSMSQEKIAHLCGVSKDTIRSWVCKHHLQKPLGTWTIGVPPHNKGRTKYDYQPLMTVSQKCLGRPVKKRFGPDNPMYRGDLVGVGGAYRRTHLVKPKTGECCLCGATGVVTNIHHLDHNPKNTSENNLAELCIKCHKFLHKGYVVRHSRISTIGSIEPQGFEDTFDIEMASPGHNFVANGFVVHNSQQSQRYVRLDSPDYVMPKTIKADEDISRRYRQLMEKIWEEYRYLAQKVPAEDARYVLPNACTTNIVVTMNARELWHFFSLRCCNRAQQEIREVADEMLRQAKEVSPTIFKNAGPPCVRGKCPEGKMSCGKPRKREFATLK